MPSAVSSRSLQVNPPSSSSITLLYRALALAGLVATWAFNIRYLQSGGSLTPGRFWADAFANPLTSAITIDVYLSALVFSVWVWHQTAAISRWRALGWIALCFGVGLVVALPLYLARHTSATKGAGS
jgi:hypothetical protein